MCVAPLTHRIPLQGHVDLNSNPLFISTKDALHAQLVQHGKAFFVQTNAKVQFLWLIYCQVFVCRMQCEAVRVLL